MGAKRAEKAAWSYESPTTPFAAVRGHLAFYASLMDTCFVDGKKVSAQAGNFYGGWIAVHLVGPFK